jgi:hypothetical protein
MKLHRALYRYACIAHDIDAVAHRSGYSGVRATRSRGPAAARADRALARAVVTRDAGAD